MSSSLGLKKTLKLARGKEKLTSRGLIFGGFFNPWDEEISIPDTRLIRKSYIYHSIKLPFDVEVAEQFLKGIYYLCTTINSLCLKRELMVYICKLWLDGLSSFKWKVTKLDRFWDKNQYTQRKLLYYVT